MSSLEKMLYLNDLEQKDKVNMIKDTLKEIIQEPDACVALKQSGLSKVEVKALADQGDLDAQLILLLGLSAHDYRTWTEVFVDEETNESIPIERFVTLDSTLFETTPGEVEALSQKLEALIPEQDDETLKRWWRLFCTDALYPAIPQELARRGDADAISELDGYNYSPLEHPQVLADDFNPRESIIMISGHPLYLDQIGYMVEDLTKAQGTPDNECGLFVPLEFVFDTLGFKWVHNTGNLMHFTRHSEPVLTLEIEANPHVDEALVDAFQKAYPKLTVEVVDNSPGA